MTTYINSGNELYITDLGSTLKIDLFDVEDYNCAIELRESQIKKLHAKLTEWLSNRKSEELQTFAKLYGITDYG